MRMANSQRGEVEDRSARLPMVEGKVAESDSRPRRGLARGRRGEGNLAAGRCRSRGREESRMLVLSSVLVVLAATGTLEESEEPIDCCS